MKLSSIEALWETADPAPFAIAADINMDKSRNDTELAIPGVFSFMLYNKPSGEVRGVNALQKEYQTKYGPGDYRPDVPALFWSFRIMVGAGGIMLLLAFTTALLALKGRLLSFPLLLKILPFLLPLPFLANSTGWFITEAGRQPWIVVGLQRTAEAVSPNLTACSVWLTLIGFTVLYLLLILAALYIAFRHIQTTTIPDEGRNA
jgi:cytochrome d ubiquinol oxidase subunit I